MIWDGRIETVISGLCFKCVFFLLLSDNLANRPEGRVSQYLFLIRF